MINMTRKKIAFREKRKGNKNKRCRYLRKRKPKRQGSRNQTGKRMPVWYPVFFLTKGIIGVSMAAAVMIVIMLPFFMFAMFERHGQPLEVLLKHYIEARFIRPRTRVYETENFYGTVERNIRNKREVNRILHGKDKRKNQTDTG